MYVLAHVTILIVIASTAVLVPAQATAFNALDGTYLCLGGRSHEAYSNRVVIHSVSQSVCLNDFSSLAEKLSAET